MGFWPHILEHHAMTVSSSLSFHTRARSLFLSLFSTQTFHNSIHDGRNWHVCVRVSRPVLSIDNNVTNWDSDFCLAAHFFHIRFICCHTSSNAIQTGHTQPVEYIISRCNFVIFSEKWWIEQTHQIENVMYSVSNSKLMARTNNSSNSIESECNQSTQQ